MAPVIQTVRAATIATLTNYVTYSWWTLANKWQFVSEEKGGLGVTIPVLSTSFQMLMAGFVSYLFVQCFRVQRQTDSQLFSWKVLRERILPLGMARGVDIGCGNFALALVSVSIQQVVKSLLPVFVSLLSVALLKKKITRDVWLSLVPIMVGCVLATVSKTHISALGLFLALTSCVARSFKAVLNAQLLHCEEDNLKPLEILLLEAPTTGCLLFVPGVILEGPYLVSYIWQNGIWASLTGPLFWYNVGCGVLMFFNQGSYITIIEQTSALTCQVLMNLKMLILILVSVYVFRTALSFTNYLGIFTATIGVFLYAQVLNEKNRRQRIEKSSPV